MPYSSIATALAPLNGDWYWHFHEQELPLMAERRLTFRDGQVFASGQGGEELEVENDGATIRLKVGDESELRFALEDNGIKSGDLSAYLWVPRYAEEEEQDDADQVPLDFGEYRVGEITEIDDGDLGQPIGMEPCEAAFLVRVENVSEEMLSPRDVVEAHQ